MMRATVLAVLVALLLPAQGVDRGNFKTCSQTGFCSRLRDVRDTWSAGPVTWDGAQGTLTLTNEKGSTVSANLDILASNAIRWRVRETEGFKRHSLDDNLEDTTLSAQTIETDTTDQRFRVTWLGHAVEIEYKPFRIHVYREGALVMTANADSRFQMETGGDGSQHEETFKSFTDKRPYGDRGIALDIIFTGSHHVYGIPEHASHFVLKDTQRSGKAISDPYRLYNLDVFKYELDEPMALYGSIPFLLSHTERGTSGLFWNNAAETFVDIDQSSKGRHAHFMSESGLMDVFLFAESNVHHQYALLTGFPALPQRFAVAYHQCRWNYRTQDDVTEVDENFDVHGIPMDVMWLDIEHTNDKRYFTWDKNKFPDPESMQLSLATKGRRLVTVVDPHIKVDDEFPLYKNAKSKFYVKKEDGSDFEGWCWPGKSSYLDFVNPKARAYWSEQYSRYDGATKFLYTWNDMNEPSVFDGPEITMQKDLVHHGNVEHRDIHNIFGMYVHQATFEGHLLRSNHQDRPFVLSRAFFAGSQRYGAIWTGDNEAEWQHLAYAQPMLLSIGIAGLPFAGSDVGGFFGNPEPELLVRWYQAAAFHPFFRAHAHIETKRREPWLFETHITDAIRRSILQRYAYLPYLYSVFHHASKTGLPVMRPMWVEFPSIADTFAIEDQFMVGHSLLVKPVTEPGKTTVTVFFPSTSVWYDTSTLQRYEASASTEVDAPLEHLPIFQRAGTIVPKQERVRRSSSMMMNDPFTLVIALDDARNANGSLYIDDGHSFDYQDGAFHLKELSFSKMRLLLRTMNSDPLPITNEVERIVIVNLGCTLAKVTRSGEALTFMQAPIGNIVIRKPSILLQDDVEVKFYCQ